MVWALRLTIILCVVGIAGCSCDMTPTVPTDSTTPNNTAPNPPDDGGDDTPAPEPNTNTPDEPAAESSCIACHVTAQGDRPAIVNAAGRDGHSARLTDADCELCHDVSEHESGVVRLWAAPGNTSSVLALEGDPARDAAADAAVSTFCLSCHTRARVAVHDPDGGWTAGCAACHAIHSPQNTNLALVRESVFDRAAETARPVTFTARTGTGSFSDGVEPADGICQVCHDTTSFHRSDGGGPPHMEGEDCTACHTHAAGFLASIEDACIVCHDTSRGSRRAVIGEFALASHHVTSGQPTNADCLACHDISEHQQGSVRLRDADSPDVVVTLDGDPMSDPAQAARLAPFCLSCHDADGAGGAPPFSDGVMPPPINASLWGVAAHNAGQTTCVGDGETFGCHSTGHGSMKANLLAPWDPSQQQGTPGDALRQEEGFCYTCHDADGPADTDIQSQFAMASGHRVSAADQVAGSKLECTNCHDPHVATADTPLIDPDTGDAWTGDREVFCLSCHDGQPPTGVSFPPTSPGTGYDKSAFVGGVHDDWTGSDSCGYCHRTHGSAEPALLLAKYVTDDYNEYSFNDGDYALCWSCHWESDVMNSLNAFEDRHFTHVRDGDSPCIACHDVHAGFDVNEPGLINLAWPRQAGYDLAFLPGYDGDSSFWIAPDDLTGGCAIDCHGELHDPETYERHDTTTTWCADCH